MNLLMISYYYPPHSAIGATRGYLVSKHLGLRGHEVRVLAAEPVANGQDRGKFPDWERPGGVVEVRRSGRAEKLMGKLRDGIFKFAGTTATSSGQDYQKQVVEASTRSREASLGGQVAAKILDTLRSDLVPEREMSWHPEVMAMALDEIRKSRPDVIVVCGRPFVNFYVGAALKKLTGIPLVLDLRDPWSLLTHHDAFTRTMLRAQERRLFEVADQILVNTHTALSRYKEVYPESITHKITAAPNAMQAWPDEEAFIGAAQDPEPLILVHGGNLYRRSISPLLQAMLNLRDLQPELSPEQAQIRQVGRIDIDTFDPALVEALGPHMQIHPFLPYTEFQQHMREASVLIVLLGPKHYLRIPAKFYECLSAGKAVLFLGPKDHEVVEVLEQQTGVGVGALASDPEDITQALLRLQSEVLPRLRERNNTKEALRPFHISTRVEEIEQILQKAIAGS